MQNPDQRENIDQYMNPANDNADVVLHNLDKEKYISAENTFSDNQDDYTVPQLEALNKSADTQIISKSQQKFPDKDLSEEEAEFGIKAAEDVEINKLGGEYFVGHKQITRADELIIKNDKILNKMDKIMIKLEHDVSVSKWSKPVSLVILPLLTSVIGISSGLELKKLLKELNQNASELEVIGTKIKTMSIGKRLDPDKISPNMGHYLQIGGYTSILGGGLVFAANPGIGAGIVAGGALTALAGKLKTAYDFFGVRATQKSLEKLKLAVSEARKENHNQNGIFDQHQSAYVKGARENIETNFPGTLAA